MVLSRKHNRSTEGNLRVNFLERYFQLSPDGGSGIVEVGYVIAAILVTALIFQRRIVHQLRWLISTALSSRS